MRWWVGDANRVDIKYRVARGSKFGSFKPLKFYVSFLDVEEQGWHYPSSFHGLTQVTSLYDEMIIPHWPLFEVVNSRRRVRGSKKRGIRRARWEHREKRMRHGGAWGAQESLWPNKSNNNREKSTMMLEMLNKPTQTPQMSTNSKSDWFCDLKRNKNNRGRWTH